MSWDEDDVFFLTLLLFVVGIGVGAGLCGWLSSTYGKANVDDNFILHDLNDCQVQEIQNYLVEKYPCNIDPNYKESCVKTCTQPCKETRCCDTGG